MPAIAPHHTPTVDEAWDGPAAVAAMPDEYGDLHYCHGWESQAAADSSHTAGDDDVDDEKDSFKFPMHKVKGGPANIRACRNALARVANSSIPDADKAGVRRHAQTHLDDAAKKSGNSARLLVGAGMQATVRRLTNLVGSSTTRKWYRFTNDSAADGGATLYIFGPIGGWFGANAEDFVEDLAGVEGPLTVHINSGGGDAFEGITISNLLRNHPSTVNGVVTGMAASAASIIAIGCDSLTMAPGSQLMIHRAMTSVYGNRDDMAEVMTMLERMDTSLAGLYQGKAGGDLADWESAMQAETWYTPEEAVDAGLADHIAEPPDKAGTDTTARATHVVSASTDAGTDAAPAPVLPVTPPAPAAPAPEAEPTTEADEPVTEPEPESTAATFDPTAVAAALRAAFATTKEARS